MRKTGAVSKEELNASLRAMEDESDEDEGDGNVNEEDAKPKKKAVTVSGKFKSKPEKKMRKTAFSGPGSGGSLLSGVNMDDEEDDEDDINNQDDKSPKNKYNTITGKVA